MSPLLFSVFVVFLSVFFSVVPSFVSSSQNRSLVINNYCGKTVWFEATAGSAPFSRPGIFNCANNTDCIPGSECHASKGTPLCFWDVPTPGNNNFRVEAGSSNRLDFPIVNNGQDVVWSGNIVGCLDGTCSDTPANCDANGCGVSGAMNLAEFTLALNAVDFYDVSIINGANIPMELAPILPNGFHLDGTDPYRCGNPGGNQMITPVPSSNWVFNVPHVEYNYVSKGGPSCSSDADCTSSTFGTKCGLSDNPGLSPRFQLTCGNFIGYWTADQVCGADASFGAPFYCSQPLTNAASAPGLTLWNMMACVGTGVDSCYANGASTGCCGCVNWNTVSGVNSSTLTEQCVNANPEWTQNILPQLTWLKQACPTCYTYPYDDMSSTFVCSMADPSIGQQNGLAYELNFCPNNKPITVVASPPSSFNATIVNADFVATISPAVGGSGARVQFSPVATVEWAIFNYIVNHAGVTLPPVQTSLQMTYSTVSKTWSTNFPDPGEGSSVQYSFNYLFSPKVSQTFGFSIPAATTTITDSGPSVGTGPSAPAPTFAAALIPNTNKTSGAIGVNIQFNTTAGAASWVILHYNVNQGGGQNVQMSLNAALSSTVWNYFIPFQLVNGTTISYSFTYLLTTAAGATDSATGSWVFTTLPPSAPSSVPVVVGSTTTTSTVPVTSSNPVTTSSTTTTTYTYAWVPGAWSGCDCTGTQTRTYSCMRNDGQVVGNSFCTGSTPSTSQSCNVPSTCTTQAPGSVLTTTDFTVQHSFSPSTSTDVVLFQINGAINYVATWVVVHYQVGNGAQLNVQMNAITGANQFSFSISSFPSTSTLTYSFTYFLNGWGARDSPVYTFTPPATAAFDSKSDAAAGYVADPNSPEVAIVGGGSGSGTKTLMVAVICSVVAVLAALAATVAYRRGFFSLLTKTHQTTSTKTPGIPLSTTPVPKVVELTPSTTANATESASVSRTVGPLKSPGPMDELISPTYRQEEEEREERERYAASQGVTRRTSV